VLAWSSVRFNLAQGGEMQQVNGMYVSGESFTTLGVSPVIGRTLSAADDVRGGGADGAVAVISYGFWQRHFGGSASAVGSTLVIERVPHTVVGVMPAGFALPRMRYLYARASVAEQAQMWTPFALWDEPYLAQMYAFVCIARLRAGVAPSQAAAELNVLEREIAARDAQTMRGGDAARHDGVLAGNHLDLSRRAGKRCLKNREVRKYGIAAPYSALRTIIINRSSACICCNSGGNIPANCRFYARQRPFT